MAAERKLDIFRTLGAADDKNSTFFSSLSEDERKEFQAFLVMRWMSGTFSQRQVFFINEFLNPYAFSLQQHKELLWMLLVVCNGGKKQRYVWNKLPSKATSSRPVTNRVLRDYYKYSTGEANAAAQVLTKDDVLELAQDLGYQPDELTKIRREYKDESSDEPTKRGKKKTTAADDLLGF